MGYSIKGPYGDVIERWIVELIKNEQEKRKIFINKLSVGERQLTAAIRMYFLKEDPLAIHIVSSAAHNVLADLMKERGKDASVHGIVYGLLRAAKDLHEGEITEDEIRAWGEGALEAVSEYRCLFEDNPDLNIGDISSVAPSNFSWAYWSDKRRSYNYLKHADRDAKELLDEAVINNEDTIFQAIVCSIHLNMKLTAEKHFFYCAMYALGKLNAGTDKPFELEFLMSGMSEKEIMVWGRRKFCSASFRDDDIILKKVAQNLKNKAEKL